MVKKYSHDEILNAVDQALLKALEESISSLKIKVGGSLQVALQTISEFIRKRRYENIRRINITPKTASVSKKRPDIWFFGGAIVIEVKVDESELEKGKKQVENYINEFFRDIAVIAIVTNGFRWEFYKVNRFNGVFTLDLINTYYADKTAYESGALLQAITTKADLYNMIKHMFNQVLAQTQIYRYRPDPETVYKVFYPILTYIDDIIEIAKKYDIPDKALYSSYKEIMTRLYAGLEKEEMLRLFAVHTLLQAIVNSILTRVLGKNFGDSIRICSGELLEPYEVSLPHLLWWREILLEGKPDDKEKLREIFDEIVSYTYLFDWTFETGLDVFSHLYEDFIERALRYEIGEYYTPWWLIEYIIHRIKERFSINLKDKLILDPACGSGRFLVRALYEKISEGEDPDKAYYEIIGLDVNPLAISIARAELIIAYKRATRNNKPLPGTPLVFWGDFLSNEIGLEAELIPDLKNVINVISQFISFDPEVINYINKLSKYELIIFLARLETQLSRIFKGLESSEEIISIIRDEYTTTDNLIDALVSILLRKLLRNEAFMKTLNDLIGRYGNEIWAIPIVSHVFVKLLRKIRPDLVLTNPPWLKLSELPKSRWGEKIRNYVKEKIIKKNRGKIPGISKAGMSGDISTIFLKTIIDILHKNGYIGIIMPAEQSYSPRSPHGAGKLLTYATIKEYNAKGDIIYVGDAFKHGRHASILILMVEL